MQSHVSHARVLARRARTSFSVCPLLLMFAAFTSSARAQTITYSQSFTQGQEASDQASTAWCDFRAQLTPRNYIRATIKGSNDPVGVSVTDATMAAQIASALLTGTTNAWTFNGRTWRVGSCGGENRCAGGIELSSFPTTTQGICGCYSGDVYTVRPSIQRTNSNWGGVKTATCGGPSQTLTVEFQYAAPASAGQLIISELRMSGPGGANDEYVELYNN
ncbi:MAG: hypothetical protein ABR554_13300, partial [Pyrinomonadaceae bacterium]